MVSLSVGKEPKLRTGFWEEYWNLSGTKRLENCTMKSSITCTLRQILLGWWNQEECDWRGM